VATRSVVEMVRPTASWGTAEQAGEDNWWAVLAMGATKCKVGLPSNRDYERSDRGGQPAVRSLVR
jgi:hypothetical protein